MEEHIFCLISYLNSKMLVLLRCKKKIRSKFNHRIEIIEKLRKYHGINRRISLLKKTLKISQKDNYCR